jgi:ribosome recycling factor
MDKAIFKKNLSERMNSSIKVLDHDLKALRTGRASANLLDSVTLEVYGDKLPITQVGTVSTPDARTITVQVWDKSLVKSVEKAIVEASLGLNPVSEGQCVRMNLPPLTEERRKELVRLAYKYGENAKVSCRNIRRDFNDELKKLEKSGAISEDQYRNMSEEVQKSIDEFSKNIDKLIKNKEQDIISF